MNRTLQKLGCLAAAALLTVGSLSACARQPQQRPGGVTGQNAATNTDVGESVRSTISTIAGANPAEAVVLGNVVLVALNLSGSPTEGFDRGPGPATTPAPGATRGGLGGTSTNPTPGNAATTPSAPGATAGRPGLTNVGVGQPGGGVTPGTTVPGGSPTGTGTTPNATGQPGLTGTSTGATTNGPGQTGTAMDLYTRVSDAIKSRFPWVAEVRFAVDRADAQHLAAIAAEMRSGTPLTHRMDDLHALASRMSPTSTTSTNQSPPAFGAPTPGRSTTTPTTPATPITPGTTPGTTPRTGTTPPAGGTSTPTTPGLPAGR